MVISDSHVYLKTSAPTKAQPLLLMFQFFVFVLFCTTSMCFFKVINKRKNFL